MGQGFVSQHAMGQGECVSQHAMGQGCVSQHAMGKGVYQSMQLGRVVCILACNWAEGMVKEGGEEGVGGSEGAGELLV